MARATTAARAKQPGMMQKPKPGPGRGPAQGAGANPLLALQQGAGNRATRRMVEGEGEKPEGVTSPALDAAAGQAAAARDKSPAPEAKAAPEAPAPEPEARATPETPMPEATSETPAAEAATPEPAAPETPAPEAAASEPLIPEPSTPEPPSQQAEAAPEAEKPEETAEPEPEASAEAEAPSRQGPEATEGTSAGGKATVQIDAEPHQDAEMQAGAETQAETDAPPAGVLSTTPPPPSEPAPPEPDLGAGEESEPTAGAGEMEAPEAATEALPAAALAGAASGASEAQMPPEKRSAGAAAEGGESQGEGTPGGAAPATEAVEKSDAVEAKAGGGKGTSAVSEGGAGAEMDAGSGGEVAAGAPHAPASPQEDPAFQGVLAQVRGVAWRQGHNNPAQKKAADAQAAAEGPPNEVASQAAGAQVDKMAAQEPAPFDKAKFKSDLQAAIQKLTPQTKEDLDQFKERGSAGALKGQAQAGVDQGKEAAQGPIKETAEQAPDPSVATPKPVTPLPPTPPGPAPAGIGAQAAAPKPKTEAEVSLDAESRSLDTQMSEAGVTEAQLEKSNEPEFQAALGTKKEAQTHAQEAPIAYRQEEAGILAGAKGQAEASAAEKTASMHGVRGEQFAQIVSEQQSTKGVDEAERAKVAQKIEDIYQATKSDVDKRLAALDGKVNGIFDQGAEAARRSFENYVDREMHLFKLERYLSRPDGLLLWGKDLWLGPSPEELAIYTAGRNLYIAAMDAVIDQVATAVEQELTAVQSRIAQGEQEIKTYIAGLDPKLRSAGEEAAGKIQSKFDTLRQQVDEKRDQLIDSLAQKYVANLKQVDDRIAAMKEASRGWVDRAKEAVGGVIEKIMQLKALILSVAANAAAVIDQILSDPISFIGNLVAGIKQGFMSFVANIGSHLKKGLMGWLFGALADAGIQLPETFDLKGILSLVLQILGLSYANIRARAVNIVGEEVVQRLEQAAEIFKILITEGPAGLWEYIKDKLGDLKSMVIEGIQSFVIERIIKAGVTWVLSLLSPASAFVKACMMIYDVIMFFVNRAAQIASLVQAILNSLAAIASGSVGALAAAVEGALSRAVPVVISFLASLLGLGGISEKIRSIIEKIQAPVNKAIDWVIYKAVELVKKVGGLFGGKKKGEDEETEEDDPEKAAKVEAGLAAIDQAEQPYLEEGKIEREEAEKVATQVKAQHPVFKTLEVVDGGETWDYDYTASPGKTKKGEEQAEKGGTVDIKLSRPSGFWKSTKQALKETFAAEHMDDEKKALLKHGLARRHIIASQEVIDHYHEKLNGQTFSAAKEKLEKKGEEVEEQPKNPGILKAAKSLLRKFFNETENLWVGDSRENSSIGDQRDFPSDWSPDKKRSHVAMVKKNYFLE